MTESKVVENKTDGAIIESAVKPMTLGQKLRGITHQAREWSMILSMSRNIITMLVKYARRAARHAQPSLTFVLVNDDAPIGTETIVNPTDHVQIHGLASLSHTECIRLFQTLITCLQSHAFEVTRILYTDPVTLAWGAVIKPPAGSYCESIQETYQLGLQYQAHNEADLQEALRRISIVCERAAADEFCKAKVDLSTCGDYIVPIRRVIPHIDNEGDDHAWFSKHCRAALEDRIRAQQCILEWLDEEQGDDRVGRVTCEICWEIL